MAESRVPPILQRDPLEYRARNWTTSENAITSPDDRTDKSSALLIAFKGWINTGHNWLYSLAFRNRVSHCGVDPRHLRHHRRRPVHGPLVHHDRDQPPVATEQRRLGDEVSFATEREGPSHHLHHDYQRQRHQRLPGPYHEMERDDETITTTTLRQRRRRTPTTTTTMSSRYCPTPSSDSRHCCTTHSTTTTMTNRDTTTSPSSSTMFRPFIILVLFASTVFRIAEGCSSRSTPKPRPPSPTLRPNITFQTYDCPEAYAKWYCLNGATCFSVRIGESILYNCECADGYMGQRCEFKDLDGSYLPNRERVMIETASIAGGVTILVFLIVILSVFACIYFRRKEKLKRLPSDVSQSELDRKPFNTRISSKNPAHLVNTRDPEMGRGMSFVPSSLATSNAHAAAAAELMRNNNNRRNGNSVAT